MRDGKILLSPLFSFIETGQEGKEVKGRLVPAGNLKHREKLKRAGLHLDNLVDGINGQEAGVKKGNREADCGKKLYKIQE